MSKFLPYMLGIAIGILIFFGVSQQRYIEKITDTMLTNVIEAESLFNEERIFESSVKVQNIISYWNEEENTMYMLLSHKDVHKIAEVLVEIDSKLKNFLSSNNISTNFATLKLYIKDMKEENKFELSNIL